MVLKNMKSTEWTTKFTKRQYKNCALLILGSAILAFGLYQIHSVSDITEGGVLGLALLFEHIFQISPAVSGFLMNALCYWIGWRLLGKGFIAYSAIAATGFSVSYKICEQFEPLWPGIYNRPLIAALAGAVFVGVGVGLCVRAGGAPSGDDALAMSVSEVTGMKIQWAYLASDLLVLGLSLLYIPWQRLIYSLITVVLSGQIIGFVQNLNINAKPQKN